MSTANQAEAVVFDHNGVLTCRSRPNGKAARGPFGSTIAHGYLTLSLVPGANGYQLTAKVTIERQGADKAACVVETVSILLP